MQSVFVDRLATQTIRPKIPPKPLTEDQIKCNKKLEEEALQLKREEQERIAKLPRM